MCFDCPDYPNYTNCPDGPDGPGGPGGPRGPEVPEVPDGPGGLCDILAGSWQDAECECLLELLELLTGPVRTCQHRQEVLTIC